jgi:hypothetical protein
MMASDRTVWEERRRRAQPKGAGPAYHGEMVREPQRRWAKILAMPCVCLFLGSLLPVGAVVTVGDSLSIPLTAAPTANTWVSSVGAVSLSTTGGYRNSQRKF